jgi:hypothetical protein
MPVKRSDARANNFLASYGDKSVELDAIDPNTLKLMVAQSIASYININAWKKKEEEIDGFQDWIKDKLANMETMIVD